MRQKSSLAKPTNQTSNRLVKGALIIVILVMGLSHAITTIGSLMINRVPKS